MPWTFKCLDCKKAIVEYRQDSEGYDIKVGICLECSQKAVQRMEGDAITVEEEKRDEQDLCESDVRNGRRAETDSLVSQ